MPSGQQDPSFSDVTYGAPAARREAGILKNPMFDDAGSGGVEMTSAHLSGAGSISGATRGGEFPNNVKRYLYFIGVFYELPGTPPNILTRAYTWSIRIFMAIACTFLVTVDTLNATILKRDDGNPGDRMPRWWATSEFKCDSSRVKFVDYDPTPPCAYFISDFALLPGFGLAASCVWVWLLIRLDDGSLGAVRSHHEKVCMKLDFFAKRHSMFNTFAVVLTVVSFSVTTSVRLQDAPFEVDPASTFYVNIMIFTVINWFLVGITIFPINALTFLLYTETYRLQCVVDDAVDVLRMQPFSFKPALHAVSFVRQEFEFMQMNYGSVMGCGMAAMCTLLACTFVGTAYASSAMDFVMYSTIVCVLSYPIALVIRSVVRLNVLSGSLEDECTTILMALPPSIDAESGTTAAVQDAMRLSHIVKQKPCEILILGYKPDAGDLIRFIVGISMVQVVSFLGLGWLF